ncbi:MFS transporter [Streptacidiphilus sp. P02-A3a]|uniref:MFS transporter n=1 Tax=Streptacidiphilus sp. P02-A3a TaxID=2704468 RepID=UPI0015F8833A|nr:MFS transporter [Streptacidiphilus sp. P02-A3a]QMU69523.1 MFS transporter [Streptacidiphilus sp. P02-A3a]
MTTERITPQTPATGRSTQPFSARRRWTALAVLVLAVLLVAVDATVLFLAIPFISESLHPSATQLLWIGDSYSFVLAGLLVSMGSLSDRIGRRRLLLIGTAAFGAASVLAAYAPGAGWLIAARALLGVAGATIMPSTLSLIRNLFPDERERAKAIGIWGAAATAGAAAGPLLGGLVLEHFWWGSVFLINIPLVILLLVLGRQLLPESRDPHAGVWDLPSVGLSLVGVIGVVYAVKEAAVGAAGQPAVIAAGVLGVLCLTWFVRRQLRLPVPLLDVRLFADRRFTAAALGSLIALIGLAGVIFFLSQYFQLVRGYSPLRAGLADMPAFAGSVAGGLIAAWLARRCGQRAAFAGGLLAMGLGLGALGWVHADTSYLLIAVVFLVTGVAEGAVYALSTTMVLNSAPKEKAGAAGAVSETAYELGTALGIALVGSVLAAVYRSGLVLPAGVTGPAAADARDSLGGAVQTAGTLPPATGDALRHSAREAFTHGMNLAAVLSGALLIGAAALVWALLRGRRRNAAGADTAGADTAPEADAAPETAADPLPDAAGELTKSAA